MANKIPRVPVREQDPKVRATNFEEVCYGYNIEEAQLEATRCLHCKNPRCVSACPVSVRIPDFIMQVAAGNFAEAAAVIAQDSSLPSEDLLITRGTPGYFNVMLPTCGIFTRNIFFHYVRIINCIHRSTIITINTKLSRRINCDFNFCLHRHVGRC